MKSFTLLFKDELYGFARSGVMITLFILLPLLSLPLYALMAQATPDAAMMFGPISILSFVALLISNIGAQITSLVLTVNIINEKQKGVYDIFVIRPLPRANILLAKFFSVFICVSMACLLAIGMGILFEVFRGVNVNQTLVINTLESFVLSLGIVGTLSAVGILFGIMTDSIIVGVILILFLGGYATYLPMLPGFLGMSNSSLWSLIFGIAGTAGILALAIRIFNKKQF